MHVACGFCENLNTCFCNPDCMFKLCRQTLVTGNSGPAIIENFCSKMASIDHWLNGKEHSLFQNKTSPGLTIMKHSWRGVEDCAQTMASEITHN